jgi:hypothetical protein
MVNENRDPEIEAIRGEWDAPPPSVGFHQRVMAAYERETAVPRWRRWSSLRVPLPVAAAAVLGAFLLAWFVVQHFQNTGPAGFAKYRPVPQPRFIIVSQGENP